MKNTVKLLGFLFLTVLPVFALTALDFDMGGTAFSSVAIERIKQTEDDPEWDILEALAVWADLAGEFPAGGDWSLGAQVRYEYADDRPWLFDLDYLRFRARVPLAADSGLLADISAGRFFFSDPTGMILTHTADGVSFGLKMPGFGFSVQAGYTGLVINPNSDIRMTYADNVDKSNEEENFFGPSRMFVMAAFMIPQLGKTYDLSIFAAGQFDLDPDPDRTLLHTQYLGVASDRRYGKYFYETLFVIAETGELIQPEEDNRFQFGFLAGGHWRFVQEDWLQSRISLRILGALPEDPDEDSTTDLFGFVPLNQPDLGETVSPVLAGLGMVELGYSFIPFDGFSGPLSRLQPFVNVRGYFRTHQNTVSWMATDPESDSIFLGTEFEGGINWRILSDIGIGLSGAVFAPAGASIGAAAAESDPLWSVRLDVSVSF